MNEHLVYNSSAPTKYYDDFGEKECTRVSFEIKTLRCYENLRKQEYHDGQFGAFR